MDWQPIETAPKDGRQIILGCFQNEPGMVNKSIMVGEWADGRFRVNMGLALYEMIFMASMQMPWTHWMPLPPDPVQS